MHPHKAKLTLLDRIVLKVGQWMRKVQARSERIEANLLRSRMKACGTGCALLGRVRATGVENISFGNNIRIGDNLYVRGEGGLTVGDNVRMSRNVTIYTVNHCYEGKRLPYDDQLVRKPVTIGRNVWIGMNVCIIPGTTIGEGAIIGMGTVVSGDVPPLSIVGGQRWRVLKSRDEGHYERIEAAGEYAGKDGGPLVPPGSAH